jgi:hypothetical protein
LWAGYWPSSVQVCGFWYAPAEWDMMHDEPHSVGTAPSPDDLRINLSSEIQRAPLHSKLVNFMLLSTEVAERPIFFGLSSVGRSDLIFVFATRDCSPLIIYRYYWGSYSGSNLCGKGPQHFADYVCPCVVIQQSLNSFLLVFSSCNSMGYLRDPRNYLKVILKVVETLNRRAVLFTSSYSPLESVIAGTWCERDLLTRWFTRSSIRPSTTQHQPSSWEMSLRVLSKVVDGVDESFDSEWFSLPALSIEYDSSSNVDGHLQNAEGWCWL